MSIISFLPERAIALEIFGFGIHWYGLLYMLGFIIGWYLMPKLQKYRQINLSKDAWSDIVSSVVLGVLIGGRLGYVVLYEPVYFIQNPLEVLFVWQGGMSSHGGFIGTAIALYYQSKKHKVSILGLIDCALVPIAIGLALGRLGNFINQELYGSITTIAWGIKIPGVEGLRHPTQLYAVTKDIMLAIVSYVLLVKTKKNGLVVACFLMLYGILRSIVEVYRVPTHSVFTIFNTTVTRGQLYSVPFIVMGMGLLIYLYMNKRSTVQSS